MNYITLKFKSQIHAKKFYMWVTKIYSCVDFEYVDDLVIMKDWFITTVMHPYLDAYELKYFINTKGEVKYEVD